MRCIARTFNFSRPNKLPGEDVEGVRYGRVRTKYERLSSRFSYAPSLVRTDSSYYNSLKILDKMIKEEKLPKGTRFMTQAESFEIQASFRRRGKDPIYEEAFSEFLTTHVRGGPPLRPGRYGILVSCAPPREIPGVSEWTSTGLRVPKGWEHGKFDTSAGYPRVVLIGDEEVAEIFLPDPRSSGYGGKIIDKWNKVFGLPESVEETDFPDPDRKGECMWRFNPEPKLDKISGHYDIGVILTAEKVFDGWGRYHGEQIICVNATNARTCSFKKIGFHPVRGSLPTIKVTGDEPIDYSRAK